MNEATDKLDQLSKGFRYGTDLYRTYLNMLQVRTVDSVVLVIPTYRDAALKEVGDIAARRIQSVFQQLYSAVRVVSSPSDTFIKELGSIHCLTKVLPDGVEFLRASWNQAGAQ